MGFKRKAKYTFNKARSSYARAAKKFRRTATTNRRGRRRYMPSRVYGRRRIIQRNGLSTVLLNRSPSRSFVDTPRSNASNPSVNQPERSQSPTTSSTLAQI